MKVRRGRRRRGTATAPGKPADATGLTIDWIGVQATGGGAASLLPWWLVWALVAIRALPFIAWNASRRLAGFARRRRDRRSPSNRA